ncbi:MAG TPA: hypothetical protein VFI29_07205 [Hanamia sp.]|nr:hypothetical protein [Hanamia sp.]
MKDIFMVLLMVFNLVIILLLNKYKNTRTGNVIGLCWFVVCISIFFLFFSRNFTMTQNIILGIFGSGGLVYFFYNFKRIVENKSA